ncbi:MAG: TAXI family TRAP transporter solute-binding subunit [Acidobacteria bacterium]|nr:TAXI family TRAP transporter solute-binding subunit [Acidobacteriota bacterium]
MKAIRARLCVVFRLLFPVSCLLCAASCAGGAPATFLSIATGGTGGVYYPYGGGLAQLISTAIPGVQATAEVTGASVDNLKLLQQGRADLAFTLADTLAEAVKGTGPFQPTGAVPVQTIAILYQNFTHIVVLRDSEIARVEDLKGRRVSVGSPGSGTEIIASRVLEAAGLDPQRDITRQALGVAESVNALKDGKIDAFFWSGGIPTPAVQDLAGSSGVRIRLLPNAALATVLTRKYGPGLYSEAVVPSRTYHGGSDDVPVIAVGNLLVAPASMPEPLAHDITALLFDQQHALIAIHPEARHLAPASSPADSPAPFHPGAIRYYRQRSWR